MSIEPITRKEKILSGEDIEPITRLEHFMKEAVGGGGGGGGSSLPSYTSADNGKVLAIDEGEPKWKAASGEVCVTYTNDGNDNITCDHTAAEIISAVTAKKFVYGFYNADDVLTPIVLGAAAVVKGRSRISWSSVIYSGIEGDIALKMMSIKSIMHMVRDGIEQIHVENLVFEPTS